MIDHEARAMLGLPDLHKLGERFMLELTSHPDGMSTRQMHKLHPDVCHMDWVHTAIVLYRAGRVRHGWRALKQPDVAAQESVFVKS